MIRASLDDQGNPPVHHAPAPRTPLCCDDWEQASHNGDLVHAFERGLVSRTDVTELGAVLTGNAPGRQSDEEITAFDSTGLAIQDLAISIEVVNRYLETPNADRFSGVETIEIG